MKGRISFRGTNASSRINKKLIFKNNASFRSCISKINNKFIDNAEDLDIAMPMYYLLEYSDNYSMTSGSFWNYYRDEVNDSTDENDDNNNMINNNKIITSKSFEYKTKIIGSTSNNNDILDAEVVVLLKYLSNFCRSPDLPLINYEIELDRTFRSVDWNANPVMYQVKTATTGATFQINNAKCYSSVVTLSIND